MNTIWSDYVQTTAELYESRAIRFRDSNRTHWLDMLGLSEGADYPDDFRVLEIGCAGGIFCHRLSTYFPSLDIVGLDRDDGHIDFANRKSIELGLRAKFVVGDATKLPFEDASFDLVFSHTVSEHIPPELFYPEQHRVLKPGGRIVVLSARPRFALNGGYGENITEEEQKLLEKAWSAHTAFDGEDEIGKYSVSEFEHPKQLVQYGFRAVEMHLRSITEYAPDNSSTTPEEARAMIESRRVGSLAPIEKAMKMNPNALAKSEHERLIALVNARYDERLAKYNKGEKLWDYANEAVLVATGRK